MLILEGLNISLTLTGVLESGAIVQDHQAQKCFLSPDESCLTWCCICFWNYELSMLVNVPLKWFLEVLLKQCFRRVSKNLAEFLLQEEGHRQLGALEGTVGRRKPGRGDCVYFALLWCSLLLSSVPLLQRVCVNVHMGVYTSYQPVTYLHWCFS